MNIPSRVNPFGYDNSLPPGYFRVEFLESTGTQRIDTGMPATNLTCTEVDFADVKNDNWAVPVAATGTNAYCIFAKGSIGVVSRVPRFDYGTSQVLASQYNVSSGRHTMRKEAERNFIDGVEVTSNAPTGSATWANIYLLYFNTLVAFMSCKLYSYKKWELGGPLQQHFIPAVNPAGVSCMYDSVTGNAYINSGSGKFIAGCTMGQAESLGSAIPNSTSITVSFPWEAKLAQYNSRVEYSLEQAGEKGCTISVQYRDPEQDSAIYNKYTACRTVDDMTAVNPDYKTDLTIDGAWEYPISSMVNAMDLFADSPMKKFSVALPSTITDHTELFIDSGLEGAVELDIYAGSGAIRTYANRTWGAVERKITSAKINLYGGNCSCHSCFHVGWGSAYDTNLESVEILTHFNAPAYMNWDGLCSNCHGLKHFYTNIEGKVRHLGDGFKGCQLDKDSVLCVEKMLMTTVTSSQTVLGIHVDWKNDPEVLEAIDKIKTRITNVYVQWNGTPTVSTFVLRQPPVYAKLDTIEDEDGVLRTQLRWGHYVSNWEEDGCQEFPSLEEAYRHFNIEMEPGV